MPPQDKPNWLLDPPAAVSDRRMAIGCIGAGFIMAECHLAAYRAAGFNPLAISSRRPERALEVAGRYQIPKVYEAYEQLLEDPEIAIVDIAVPPDAQRGIIEQAVRRAGHIRGILAQKPLGVSYRDAADIVRMCENAGVVLAVNQNMRYDQSVRACRKLLTTGELGTPVLATIEMRAVPHWAPWQQRLGWLTLRIMSIHHLDTFRFWFGEPERVYASVGPDPRTGRSFAHEDGIALYILDYPGGMRASGWDDVWAGPEQGAQDVGIRWRLEGTEGLARGTIGWPEWPKLVASTIDFTSVRRGREWMSPRWRETWFPDAFAGPMTELLVAVQTGGALSLSGRDNLNTMAIVEACYQSAREHRAVSPREIIEANPETSEA
ncbi:MAG TPA: Gfo/Idh/MocA family oxidoreductase [Pirellulales bacterium]|jgi:predicted dehydrogenase|nr:Gfo/Idh/MocA family oxidoreductase [Pirellulales bacterium]